MFFDVAEGFTAICSWYLTTQEQAMNTFCEHHKNSIKFAYRCFDRILLKIQPFQRKRPQTAALGLTGRDPDRERPRSQRMGGSSVEPEGAFRIGPTGIGNRREPSQSRRVAVI